MKFELFARTISGAIRMEIEAPTKEEAIKQMPADYQKWVYSGVEYWAEKLVHNPNNATARKEIIRCINENI